MAAQGYSFMGRPPRLRPVPTTTYRQLPLPFLRPRAEHPENKPHVIPRSVKIAGRSQSARIAKEDKIEKERQRVASQPHPILGYHLGLNAVEPESDLRRAILDKHEVWGIGDRPLHPRTITPSLTDGFEHPDAEKLAEKPQATRWRIADLGKVAESSEDSVITPAVDAVRRLINLRNGSAADIHQETKRRIIETFRNHPDDTSGPEITIALLTYRLKRTWAFLQENPKVVPEREQLQLLHARRRRELRKLQLHEPERFLRIIKRCGIDERAATAHVIFVRTRRQTRRRRQIAARPLHMKSF